MTLDALTKSDEIFQARHLARVDEYDQGKFKFHANISWLCSFIPLHHKDRVKNNLRKNLPSLQLPPHTADAVWRDVISLLVSCEVYRCACLAVFGAPAPQNHWEVIQTLSRHGFYAVTGTGHGVIQSSLLSASPFIQEAHNSIIDCLMQAYSCTLVTIPKVVSVVKKIGTFNASQELPYDLEDALVLWINKVCGVIREKVEDERWEKETAVKQGRLHPTELDKIPLIPFIEDLVQDISDGQCLGVLLHYYLPKDLPLDVLKLGDNLLQCDKGNNLAAIRFTIMTNLGMDWFPFRMELLLNPSHANKPNIIVFISELFSKFEGRGKSRNEYGSDKWIKEEERSGGLDLNCAAVANEISLQLEKLPVVLECTPSQETFGLALAASDSEEEDDEVYRHLAKLTPVSHLEAPPLPLHVHGGEEPDGGEEYLQEAEKQSVTAKNLEIRNADEKASSLPPDIFDELTEEEVKNTSLKYFQEALRPPRSPPQPSTGNGILEERPKSGMSTDVEDVKSVDKEMEVSADEVGDSEDNEREAAEDADQQQHEKQEGEGDEPVVYTTTSLPPTRKGASGELIVQNRRSVQAEKREFYSNIAQWVASVEKECKVDPIPSNELLSNPTLSKTLQHHFTKRPTSNVVAESYVIEKGQSESEALSRGIPVITPAPAPPYKIKEDYNQTVFERDEAIRKEKEETERKIREEIERKRLLEEQLAEEKRLEELADAKKAKKGGKKGGKGGGKGGKESKTFPKRPTSGGSTSSGGSNKTGKKGKGKADLATKSDKSLATKKDKVDVPKRRAKSANKKLGKNVSFIDEKEGEADLPPVEEPPPPEPEKEPECPHKKDTRVIGDDSTKMEKTKVAFFVSMTEPQGKGVGSGPLLQHHDIAYPAWNNEDDRSQEDGSMEAMGNVSESGESESEEGESDSYVSSDESLFAEDKAEKKKPSFDSFDPAHIINSLKPQFSSEPAYIIEPTRNIRSTPLPTDPKELMLHLQMKEKRRVIEQNKHLMRDKWAEERSKLNRHVFYEAIKKTRDISQQVASEDIKDDLDRIDSLNALITYHSKPDADDFNTGPFTPFQANTEVTPSSMAPPSELEKTLKETEEIFRRKAEEEEEEEEDYIPRDKDEYKEQGGDGTETEQLNATFSDHGDILDKENVKHAEESISDVLQLDGDDKTVTDLKSTTTNSGTPTTLQYFYGFVDVTTDNKIAEKRQQFLLAQRRKQEEVKARRELEMQRKLESARQKSAVDSKLRREDGNLVTRQRCTSAKIRVTTPSDDMITKPPRCNSTSASSSKRKIIMSYKTPHQPDTHMYPDKSNIRPEYPGNATYRKISEPSRGEVPPLETGTKKLVRSKSVTSTTPIDNNKNKRKDSTPSRPPSVPLYVEPSAKCNAKVISNALSWTCLSGVPDRAQLKKALQAMADSSGQQYVVLFRDDIANKFRGIYVLNPETEKLSKIFGVGPRTITMTILKKLYKYDSGSRSFSLIPSLNFSPIVDGVTIDNNVWKRAGVNPL